MFKPHWMFVAAAVALAACLGTLPWMIDVTGQFNRVVPWNFAPVMALGLFAGAYFKKRAWVLFVPVAIMLLRDTSIFFVTGDLTKAVYPFQAVNYLAMISGASLGLWLRTRDGVHPNMGKVFAAGILAEMVFFLVSNFGVWAGFPTYPHTIVGLLECYVAAIPFALRSFASTIVYSGLAFGGFRIWVASAQSGFLMTRVAANETAHADQPVAS